VFHVDVIDLAYAPKIADVVAHTEMQYTAFAPCFLPNYLRRIDRLACLASKTVDGYIGVCGDRTLESIEFVLSMLESLQHGMWGISITIAA
jgi:hypothetical protein